MDQIMHMPFVAVSSKHLHALHAKSMLLHVPKHAVCGCVAASPQGVVHGRTQTSRHTQQVSSSRSWEILSNLCVCVCVCVCT